MSVLVVLLGESFRAGASTEGMGAQVSAEALGLVGEIGEAEWWGWDLQRLGRMNRLCPNVTSLLCERLCLLLGDKKKFPRTII